MKPHLFAYCLDWHINQSRAFYDLLVDPLESFAAVQLVEWDGRGADPLGNWKWRVAAEPTIFCQRPPPPELFDIPGARLVWIPMWDNVAQNWTSDQWWSSLPKSLRVIAFSDGVARKSEAANLPTLRLRYHKNPAEFDAVDWKSGRTLLYWNRTGLFGPDFLRELCTALDARKLFFRGTVDPKITPIATYRLPARLGKTMVHEISGFQAQSEYFDLLRRCNIYLAPRALEGVGLTFLEAMASGSAVLAYDAPTMNEYIIHGLNGYLFPAASLGQDKISLIQQAIDSYRGWKTDKPIIYPKRISAQQDWEQLENIDLEMLGSAARAGQEAGFAVWQDQIAKYARFVLDW